MLGKKAKHICRAFLFLISGIIDLVVVAVSMFSYAHFVEMANIEKVHGDIYSAIVYAICAICSVPVLFVFFVRLNDNLFN